MKTNKIVLPILMILIILLMVNSCATSGSSKSGDPHWAGMYVGVIPAADCPGIAVVVILNADGRYKITYQYIDRDVSVVTYSGSISWDEKTKVITLEPADRLPPYQIGRNKLTFLDMEGKKISGKLADNYVLRKVNFPY